MVIPQKGQLKEAQGVSNNYLQDFVQFILQNQGTDHTYKFEEIQQLFKDFPPNLFKKFEGCRLKIGQSGTQRNGQCTFNKRWKLITVSVSPYTVQGQRSRRQMETTLYHELAHMIDYVVQNDKVGDTQTRTMSAYNNKFINRKSEYKEFSHMMYGFSNLEMRGRLASFKEMVDDLLQELTSDKQFLSAMKSGGYNATYKVFAKKVWNSDAYRYAIGRYEENYENLIKNCNYGNFGWRGTIEMANNLKGLIGLKEEIDMQNPTQEQFEYAKSLLVNYFDNLIHVYNGKLAKIALSCWYKFVENLQKKYNTTSTQKQRMRNFLASKPLF